MQLQKIRYQSQLHLMLLPYAIGIVLLVFIPAVISFALAFFRYDGLSPPVWVGDLNFILAYTDGLFALSVQNSLALVILPAPLRVIGAFLLARLLLRNGRFLAAFRAAVYMPSVIPTAAYALAWLWVLNPIFGPLNLLLQAAGIAGPGWLAESAWAKPGLALLLLWQIGEGFLVSLAALQDIPADLEDAATVDGATRLQQFFFIQLPLMAPILLLLTFRDAILLLQESFAAVFLMTEGGPYYATYTLPLFIYEQGFDLLFFGTASAALWVLYVLAGLIVVLLIIVARQWNVGTTEETFVI